MGFMETIANMRGRPERATNPPWPMGYASIGHGAIELADGLTASYASIYRQPYVFAAVNKIAKTVASMPLKAYQREPDGARDELERAAPLSSLMRRPMPYMQPSKHNQRIVKNVICYGNAIVVKLGMEGEGDTPDELMVAPPIGWAVGEGDTFVYTNHKGERIPFHRWQIMHYCHWDLNEDGFGMSMLEPLRRSLMTEDFAQRYAAAAFKHGARPGAVLKTDKTLTQATADALAAQMKIIHGGVDNAFKTAVLQEGLNFATIEHDLEKAALIEHRKLSREEVASVIDVPQPAIGILDNTNFASIQELHLMLYQDSLSPWTTLFKEVTQTDLIDVTNGMDGQFVEFDLDALLRGDPNMRSQIYQRLISIGVLTQNEARRYENLPRSSQPEADQLHTPVFLAPNPAMQEADNQGGVPR